MAERYGGKYSPDNARPSGDAAADTPRPYRGAKRTRAGGRVNALFFAPLFIALVGFAQDGAGLAIRLLAVGCLLLAAWLTREGLRAQEAFDARKVAKRPAFPRKIFGSLLTGIGIGIAATASMGGIIVPLALGIAGAVLHTVAFGIDPLADKGVEGVDQFQSDRVARAVDEAEKHLSAMKDAILRAEDRRLEARVDKFSATAREMFRTVEEDPRDLTGARKYLGVYLLGAKDATVKFADLYSRTRDDKARDDYVSLLDDLEQSFAARTETMLLDDRSDLDVEIGVLRDRLAREGVRTE